MKANIDLTDGRVFHSQRVANDALSHSLNIFASFFGRKFTAALKVFHWQKLCIEKPSELFIKWGATFFDRNVDYILTSDCICECCGKAKAPWKHGLCNKCESINELSLPNNFLWSQNNDRMVSNPSILYR